MKNGKKYAWIMSDNEYAAAGVLHQVTGYLKAKRTKSQTVDVDELLQYIDQAMSDELKRLKNTSDK